MKYGLQPDGSYMTMEGETVRADMIDAIKRYLYDGLTPGGFLIAVLANDLAGAASRADADNRRNLAAYGHVLMFLLPVAAWGSYETVGKWLLLDDEGRAAMLAGRTFGKD